MKVHIMREFVRLTETQNYTKTAEELYIAQSALSRHIVSVEEEVGSQLINRSRNTFELTPAGEIVRDSFQNILAEYEDMLVKLSHLAEYGSGELRVGVLYYDYDYYVSKIREAFRTRHPKVNLSLHSYQPMQIEQDLLSGKLDAAFLYGVEDRQRPDIRAATFLKIPLVIMYDKSHRLSHVKDIQVADLNGEQILWPEMELKLSRTGQIVKNILEQGGAYVRTYIPIENFDEVPYLLRETQGIYISPMANVNAYRDSVEYRYLNPDIYSINISVVWRSDNQNPAIKLLLNTVKICYP